MIVVLIILSLVFGQISDAFLWVYFTGNNQDQEQIRFAISTNGFDFTALNKNNPVINSADIAEKKAVRDPHILRGEDGTFYMVATDMRSADGWSSNVGIVMLKSNDLITWSSSRVNMHTAFPNDFGNIDRAWAPQTIWDPAQKRYMVYFSMHVPNGVDKIYYAYANADFTGLSTTPKQLYFPDDAQSCIDGDIVLFEGKYYLFYKTEGHGNGIRRAIAPTATGNYTLPNTNYVQPTTDAVEGSCTYPLGNGTWVLIYDVYNNGRYDFATSTDLMTFKAAKGSYSGFSPRHGTILPITTTEMDRLIAKWG